MPILFYFVIWVVVTFLQVVVVPRLAILGVYPDLLTAAVILIALRSGRLTGLYIGFIFAVSVDLLDPQKLGWMTLLTSLLGYCVGVVRDTIYIENPWFESIMVLFATLVYHIVFRFFTGPAFFFDNFLRMTAESIFIAIYTVAIVGLLIWLVRQKYSLRDVV